MGHKWRYCLHMRRQISEAFGKAVRQVLESRQGMSIRAADRRTGINHVSIGRMAEGYIPEMETVVRWARGFNLDVNEWLRLAGYDPLGTETPQQRFWARFGEAHARLAAEGIHLPAPAFDRDYPGWDNLSDADIDSILTALEQMARQGPPAPPAVPPPEALDDLALRLADIARQIRSAQPRPPETRLTTGTIPPE